MNSCKTRFLVQGEISQLWAMKNSGAIYTIYIHKTKKNERRNKNFASRHIGELESRKHEK